VTVTVKVQVISIIEMFTLRIILVIACLLVLITDTWAISQQSQVLLYNVGYGGIVGAIGAVMNRNESSWYRAFVKGLIQGSFGGLICYEGKRMAYEINKNRELLYGWPSKIVHATGASIIENAAANNYLWESWSVHFGFVRFETKPATFPLRVKFLPFAFGGFLMATACGRLKVDKTFQLGQPYFRKSTFELPEAGGYSFGNQIIVNEDVTNVYEYIAHEYIHNYQYREGISLNKMFTHIHQEFSNYEIYNRLSEHIYIDTAFMAMAYHMEDQHSYAWKYKNYFELEAKYCSTLRNVPIPWR